MLSHAPSITVFSSLSALRNVNVFLVALNAEIKFRRYFKMIENHPPPIPLPDDVLALMRRVVELVRLLYWKPVSAGYSQGTPKKPVRARRPTPAQYMEMSAGEDSGTSADKSGTSVQRTPTRRRKRWLPDADAETRRAYGTALMGIQGTAFLYFTSPICER